MTPLNRQATRIPELSALLTGYSYFERLLFLGKSLLKSRPASIFEILGVNARITVYQVFPRLGNFITFVKKQ